MIDASHFPFEENIQIVKRVVDFAINGTAQLRLSWGV